MSAEEKSMSIIVTKGSLDWAYPPFILATTAAAMGLPVTDFRPPQIYPALIGLHIGFSNSVNNLASIWRNNRRPHSIQPHQVLCGKWFCDCGSRKKEAHQNQRKSRLPGHYLTLSKNPVSGQLLVQRGACPERAGKTCKSRRCIAEIQTLK